MKAKITGILLFAIVLSCSQMSDEENMADQSTPMKMAEVSELAQLMKDMHSQAKTWREAVISGQTVVDSIDFYAVLVSSTPTKKDIQTPAFQGLAKHYQNSFDTFLSEKEHSLNISAYNNMISACITCHEGYCTGPIPTIKKLYISEN